MTNENVHTGRILGRYTIIRKRLALSKPWHYRSGKCYHAFHGGKWSLYIQKSKPAKKVNISINDK